MAVLDRLKVVVRVGGKPIQEHDDPDTDSNETEERTVARYIEVVSEAPFEFVITLKKGFEFHSKDVNFQLDVDGETIARLLIHSQGREVVTTKQTIDCSTVRFNTAGKILERSLQFSEAVIVPLEHENSQDLVNGGNLRPGIGTLKVTAFRQSHILAGQVFEPGARFDPCRELSEKSTKGQAMSHTVSLGPEKPPRAGVVYYAVGPRETIGAFEFKYRSKKALQDLMVIPRSPSPVRLEDRPVEDMSTEEMRELIERQRRELSLREESRRVKRERIKSDPDDFRSKRLRTGDPESDSDMEITVRERNIEVIDLLD